MQETKTREVTGRTVLFWLLAFFGVVFLANAVMIRAAVSTFRGVEVASSYKAGLRFGQDVADVRAQDALGWRVSGTLDHDRNGDARLSVIARDRQDVPLAGFDAQARLIHPADSRRDVAVPMRQTAAGVFQGVASAPPGQWELEIEISRGDERMFRSRSRVTLR
jgi:nitrogen fixation protein FixH